MNEWKSINHFNTYRIINNFKICLPNALLSWFNFFIISIYTTFDFFWYYLDIVYIFYRKYVNLLFYINEWKQNYKIDMEM